MGANPPYSYGGPSYAPPTPGMGSVSPQGYPNPTDGRRPDWGPGFKFRPTESGGSSSSRGSSKDKEPADKAEPPPSSHRDPAPYVLPSPYLTYPPLGGGSYYPPPGSGDPPASR